MTKHRHISSTTTPNISSVVSVTPLPGAAVYSATKAAVDAVTKSLAKELGPRGIRVNAINPGMVETEWTHTAGITEGDLRHQVEAQTPLGRDRPPGGHRVSGGVPGLIRCLLDHG